MSRVEIKPLRKPKRPPLDTKWVTHVDVDSPTIDELRAWLIAHPDNTWSGQPSWGTCPIACLLLSQQSHEPGEMVCVRTIMSEWMAEFTQTFDAAITGFEDFEAPAVLTSADVLKILDELTET